MATPLSGALLHAEVLRRTLRQRQFDSPELDGSLRSVQEGLDEVAALLDAIGEKLKAVPDPALFSASEALRRGARRHEERGATRGVSLLFPDQESAARLLGSAAEVEDAVADVTALAVEMAAPGSSVAWRISALPAEVALSCRFVGSLAESRLAGLLGAWRRETDEERGGGLLFARWAIEAQGGRLTLARAGDSIEARAALPAGEAR